MQRDKGYIPPTRETRRDKLNRYWPNVKYLGDGIVGLAECTYQTNKAHVCKVRTITALKNIMIRVTKNKVFLKIPDVRFYDFYLNLKYTDDLNDSTEWDGNEANVGVRCIFYTGNYRWRAVGTHSVFWINTTETIATTAVLELQSTAETTERTTPRCSSSKFIMNGTKSPRTVAT